MIVGRRRLSLTAQATVAALSQILRSRPRALTEQDAAKSCLTPTTRAYKFGHRTN